MFPDRVAMISALKDLAPIYKSEQALNSAVIECILCLPEKTDLEKTLINEIAQILLGKSAGELEAAGIIKIIVNIVSRLDENAFDLFENVVELFLRREAGIAANFQIGVKISFALTNYFRAPASLIRYGAALCIHAIVSVFPDFLDKNKHLYPYVVSGLIDSDNQTANIYYHILNLSECANSVQIKNLVSQILKAKNFGMSGYDDIVSEVQIYSPEKRIHSLLDLIAKQSPSISSLMLQKMANSLEYLSASYRKQQIALIKVWGQNSDKLDSYILHALLPLSQSLDENLQIQAVDTLSALLPSFSTLSADEVVLLWNYILPLLDKTLDSVSFAYLEIVKKYFILVEKISFEET